MKTRNLFAVIPDVDRSCMKNILFHVKMVIKFTSLLDAMDT